MLGVSQCDQEASASSGRHCFEVITPGRPYLFASESDADMNEWIDTIKDVSYNNNNNNNNNNNTNSFIIIIIFCCSCIL